MSGDVAVVLVAHPVHGWAHDVLPHSITVTAALYRPAGDGRGSINLGDGPLPAKQGSRNKQASEHFKAKEEGF